MRMNRFTKAVGMIGVLLLLCSGAWTVQAGSTESSTQAALSGAASMAMPGDVEAHEFAFSHGKVQLMVNGEWKVDAWVQHGGLLCGTYRVGVQFGIGKQGCQSVDWLEQPVFVTRQKQCNSVRSHHNGYGATPQIANQFKAITCARRVVRCTGKCDGGGNVVSEP